MLLAGAFSLKLYENDQPSWAQKLTQPFSCKIASEDPVDFFADLEEDTLLSLRLTFGTSILTFKSLNLKAETTCQTSLSSCPSFCYFIWFQTLTSSFPKLTAKLVSEIATMLMGKFSVPLLVPIWVTWSRLNYEKSAETLLQKRRVIDLIWVYTSYSSSRVQREFWSGLTAKAVT